MNFIYSRTIRKINFAYNITFELGARLLIN